MEPLSKPATFPVAIFDFDGTVIKEDSTLLLLRHILSEHPRALAQAPQVALAVGGWLLGVMSREAAKARVLRVLDSVPAAEREPFLRDFHDHILLPRYLQGALAQTRWHQSQGHRLILASASVDAYLWHVARRLGADQLVCSRSVLQPRVRLVGRNCRGAEKTRRLSELPSYPLIRWPDSWVYSDSLSDLPLFRLCGHPVAVNPERALRRHAIRNGWMIVEWCKTADNDANQR